jgi:hypothetical protein
MRVNFVRKVRYSLSSLVGAVLLASFAIGAETPEQDAINHLLQFVETSRCTFLRNGVEYDSKGAVNHIKEKYDYFKRQIHTAEDFIALAATKSELSGRPYFVRCEKGKEMPAANWLHEELQDYRKTTKDKSRESYRQYVFSGRLGGDLLMRPDYMCVIPICLRLSEGLPSETDGYARCPLSWKHRQDNQRSGFFSLTMQVK